MKKWGHASLDKAPEAFLNQLAVRMTTQSYAPQELIVGLGDYGTAISLVLVGGCKVVPGPTDDMMEPWLIEASDRVSKYAHRKM